MDNKTKFSISIFLKYSFIILILGIFVLIYKWKEISAYYDDKNQKEKYEKLMDSIQRTKIFDNWAISALEIPKITLKTRWKDDFMYYKFYLFSNLKQEDSSFYDSFKKDVYFESRIKTISSISINFLDRDGFKIYILKISIGEMTRIIDNNGVCVAYFINSSIAMKPETYKDLQTWELTYK